MRVTPNRDLAGQRQANTRTMRLRATLGLASLVAAACVSFNPATSGVGSQLQTPIASASPSRETSLGRTSAFFAAVDPGDLAWQYAGTLLLPTDPNTYANELLDVRPLSDGGWVVIAVSAPVRQLRTGSSTIAPRPSGARVIRLDAAGNVVARQTDESFSPTHLLLFESSGVIVAEGGGTRGLDLRTLDTLWATDAECVVVVDHCFAYQPFTMSPPGTFEERDPRTFSMLRALPHVKVGQLSTPMILADWNLAVVQSKVPDHWFEFFPLDVNAPISLPWISRLTGARSIAQVSPDRVVVSYEDGKEGGFLRLS